MSEYPQAEIGVFGGSGFYELLDNPREHKVNTPFGAPSSPVMVGEIGGRTVAFLPRHGKDHSLPPHMINYRANLWAMKELGVTQIIGPNACGSLQPDVEPGHFVICDQFVDRTWGRKDTFYDGPITTHVSSADPYCPTMRQVAIDQAADARHHRAPDRHRRRDPGSALLDSLRVEVVRLAGLGGHQHDPVPRGLSRSRTRDLLREHLADHRSRRWRRGRRAGLQRRGHSRVQREQQQGQGSHLRDDSRAARRRATACAHTHSREPRSSTTRASRPARSGASRAAS